MNKMKCLVSNALFLVHSALVRVTRTYVKMSTVPSEIYETRSFRKERIKTGSVLRHGGFIYFCLFYVEIGTRAFDLFKIEDVINLFPFCSVLP